MSDTIDVQALSRELVEFDVRSGPPLVARRRRRTLPFRVLRLLTPHVVVKVRLVVELRTSKTAALRAVERVRAA